MVEDREIAGIRCMRVLEKLDDYVAGELPEPEREQIDAHLRGCDWCTKFGGRYASLVSTLRSGLLKDDEMSPDEARQFAERLVRSDD